MGFKCARSLFLCLAQYFKFFLLLIAFVGCVEISLTSKSAKIAPLQKETAQRQTAQLETAQLAAPPAVNKEENAAHSLLALEAGRVLGELEKRLSEMKENPSARMLARLCASAGSMATLLKVLSILEHKLVEKEGDAKSGQVKEGQATPGGESAAKGKFSNPAQWISTSAQFAPLCDRSGSSSEHYAEDLVEIQSNVASVARFFR